MTRIEFRALVAAGDRRADEAVAEALGWKRMRKPLAKALTWRGPLKHPLRHAPRPPPFATCPDDDPQSWPLFGEMFDALPHRMKNHRWDYWRWGNTTVDVGFCHAVCGYPANPDQPQVYVRAQARCAAAAEALLEALGKFEEETDAETE